MTQPILAVDGLSAVGKGDLSKSLAQYYGVQRISIGDIWGELATKQGITRERLNELASEDEKSTSNRKVHEHIAGFIFRCQQERRGGIIVGCCSTYIVRDIFPTAAAIFLSSEPFKRFTRIQQQKGNQQKSIGEIANTEAFFEQFLGRRMNNHYGKELRQVLTPGQDDICINTTALDAEHVLRQAIGELEQHSYSRD